MVKQTAGRDSLGEFAPQFAALNDDVLFGQVWSRENKLSLRDRSLVTVSVLMGKGILDDSLQYHLISARNNGISRAEMAEILTHTATAGGGQILFCIEGEGWYQEEGKPARSLAAGDVVVIPANVKHWHGAKADSWFSHIAIEVPGVERSTIWDAPVTDEEYTAL